MCTTHTDIHSQPHTKTLQHKGILSEVNPYEVLCQTLEPWDILRGENLFEYSSQSIWLSWLSDAALKPVMHLCDKLCRFILSATHARMHNHAHTHTCVDAKRRDLLHVLLLMWVFPSHSHHTFILFLNNTTETPSKGRIRGDERMDGRGREK